MWLAAAARIFFFVEIFSGQAKQPDYSGTHQTIEMPRSSSRQKLLRRVKGVLEERGESALTRELLSDEDSDEDDLDMFWEVEYERIQATRYVSRASSYQTRKDELS